MNPDEYDPRIAMAPGYRRPRPKPKERRWLRWLRRLLVGALMLVVLIGGAIAGGLAWLARAPIVPRIDRTADYRPLAVTRFRAPTGEVVAEIAGAHRRLVPPDKMPPVLARAVVARWEPRYLERAPLDELDLARALRARLGGKPEPASLTLQLVRSLSGRGEGDPGLVRFTQEWLAAIRLERKLTRPQLLSMYLNEVPFGRGAYGAEEGARAHFGRPLSSLDELELTALADLSDQGDTAATGKMPDPEHVGCGELAAKKLADRYDPDALAHLGAEVVTPCEPALEKAIAPIVKKARLERTGLAASVLVVRLPGQEVVAAVGDVTTPRPLEAMRAPFVLAAALASNKWSMASPLEPGGPTLRVIATRSLIDASDGLITAGLSRAAAQSLAAKAGITSAVDPESFCDGSGAVTPLELASALAAFAEGGQHRMPQLLRSVGGVAETEGAKAALQAFSPEVAYLVTSLGQVRVTAAPPPTPRKRGASAWTAPISADVVVLVWVGAPDGRTLTEADGADHAAATIAREVQAAALRGRPPKPFVRPRSLIARRVDGAGNVVPNGYEEWFVPGTAPREEAVAP